MKVIKVLHSLDFGGIEKVFETVADYYPGAKSDLMFVAIGSGGKAERHIREKGYRVIVLNEQPRIPNFRIIRALRRLFREERPDVVHACGAEGNFHGLVAAWLSGVRVRVGEEIGMPSHSAMATRIFKFVYGRSTAVIAVASKVKDYLVSRGEVSSDKCKLIYNPVDVNRFSIQRKIVDGGDFNLLIVCRLHPIKNLDRLIRCVANVRRRQPRLKLHIVGDGAIRQELETLAHTLDTAGAVTFHGFQADPSRFLTTANGFILPSLSEGHPVSLVEAMVAGVPAIATQVGGAPEIIEPGVTGWLIDPLRDESIEEAIEELMNASPARLEDLTRRAREYALAHFSPASYFQQLSELYTSAL